MNQYLQEEGEGVKKWTQITVPVSFHSCLKQVNNTIIYTLYYYYYSHYYGCSTGAVKGRCAHNG